MKKIDIISLGCSKNLVETERLMRRLEAKGYILNFEPESPSGDIVVVNTCGFISDAKEESINTILNLCEKKKERKIRKIVVMGCLSQRYLDELKKEIPEVDIWLGKFDWNKLLEILPDMVATPEQPRLWERKLTTPPHSAYLKISEGCNRFCAFCAIPGITGRHTSRRIEEILAEVRDLVSKGVKEFNVIAQDLSSYGLDLYGRKALAELIDRIADIPGVEWIRLHYAYPADFPLDILDVMARRDNVCKYLDIALQHIADPVLKNMRRHISGEETVTLLKTIREKVPGIKIRTTLMTGFPGEGEKEFEQLLDFVRTQRFDRMGAFTYCEEEDTFAAGNLPDEIAPEIKQHRLDRLMTLQQEIALENNEKEIGRVMKVIVDRIEGETSYCRSEFDSPDVDPEIIVNSPNLIPGEFVNVKIIKAYPFELIGVVTD